MSDTPRVVKMRYSLTHEGWFWQVEAMNPFPSTIHSLLDVKLIESGYAKRRRSADRAAQKAVRTMHRQIARARRELGTEA